MPRGNKNNLVSFSDMTVERQREIASKGGKASQEKRKQRKTFKEQMLFMLENDPNLQNELINALFKRAKKTGDKSGMSANKAFELIRETIGEAPVEETKTIVEIEDSTPLAKMLGIDLSNESNQDSKD